jgi:hypothetical protein
MVDEGPAARIWKPGMREKREEGGKGEKRE